MIIRAYEIVIGECGDGLLIVELSDGSRYATEQIACGCSPNSMKAAWEGLRSGQVAELVYEVSLEEAQVEFDDTENNWIKV